MYWTQWYISNSCIRWCQELVTERIQQCSVCRAHPALLELFSIQMCLHWSQNIPTLSRFNLFSTLLLHKSIHISSKQLEWKYQKFQNFLRYSFYWSLSQVFLLYKTLYNSPMPSIWTHHRHNVFIHNVVGLIIVITSHTLPKRRTKTYTHIISEQLYSLKAQSLTCFLLAQT